MTTLDNAPTCGDTVAEPARALRPKRSTAGRPLHRVASEVAEHVSCPVRARTRHGSTSCARCWTRRAPRTGGTGRPWRRASRGSGGSARPSAPGRSSPWPASHTGRLPIVDPRYFSGPIRHPVIVVDGVEVEVVRTRSAAWRRHHAYTYSFFLKILGFPPDANRPHPPHRGQAAPTVRAAPADEDFQLLSGPAFPLVRWWGGWGSNPRPDGLLAVSPVVCRPLPAPATTSAPSVRERPLWIVLRGRLSSFRGAKVWHGSCPAQPHHLAEGKLVASRCRQGVELSTGAVAERSDHRVPDCPAPVPTDGLRTIFFGSQTSRWPAYRVDYLSRISQVRRCSVLQQVM
ncbi:hypothetical protein FHX81_2778 [Saccharothrix saharensis]|uniref:Uncharacterized protein n=1 Tax=Saccharothrix saharensis TaxID=571190 RepID=A0A543JC69_9PSEU|nr:hypothetical protein FHX81_2778 [Saccharothrix saharensis]